LTNTLNEAVKIDAHPNLVLMPGDLLRHGSHVLGHPMVFLTHMTQVVGEAFASFFDEDIDVIITPGNNDLPADYDIEVQTLKPPSKSSRKNHWYSKWALSLRKYKFLKNDREFQSFCHGGFYSRVIKKENLMVISVNSIVYSINFKPTKPFAKEGMKKIPDYFGQFAWLEKQFKFAQRKGLDVIIVTHIPASIDGYGLESWWNEAYKHEFVRMLDDYQGLIKAVQFGHSHRDQWRSDLAYQNGFPYLLTASISPCFNNNPSFRIASLDMESNNFTNYKTYISMISSPGKPSYTEFYDFKQAYGLEEVETLSSQVLNDLAMEFFTNETLFSEYWQRQDQLQLRSTCDNSSPHIPGQFHNATCLVCQTCCYTNMFEDDFQACLIKHTPQSLPTLDADMSQSE